MSRAELDSTPDRSKQVHHEMHRSLARCDPYGAGRIYLSPSHFPTSAPSAIRSSIAECDFVQDEVEGRVSLRRGRCECPDVLALRRPQTVRFLVSGGKIPSIRRREGALFAQRILVTLVPRRACAGGMSEGQLLELHHDLKPLIQTARSCAARHAWDGGQQKASMLGGPGNVPRPVLDLSVLEAVLCPRLTHDRASLARHACLTCRDYVGCGASRAPLPAPRSGKRRCPRNSSRDRRSTCQARRRERPCTIGRCCLGRGVPARTR